MMKKIVLFLLAFVSFRSFAQTAEEIVEKYNTAMGGLDAFKKVQTAKYTGTATVQGTDLPVTVQIINNRAVRSDVDVNGQLITSSYKDGKGWKINALQGITTATDMESAELAEIKSGANMAGSLMDYKELGNKIELLRQETVEGVKSYKIRLTAKEDGRVTTYIISSDKFELIKTITSREMMGQQVDVETLFSDPKIFAGLKYYMTRTQSADGTVFQIITLSNIELNVPIDEKIFDK